MIRTDLGMPDPDEDPVSYNTDAVEAQGQGPQTTPYGPREVHGAVQEHNGAAYHLKHLRSAPQVEQGFTSGQGRLFPAAVPYRDQRVGEATFNGMPAGPQPGSTYGRYGDQVAMARRVQAPPHPVYFPRGRSESQAGNPMPEAPGNGPANGRTIYGGPHRTDQRY